MEALVCPVSKEERQAMATWGTGTSSGREGSDGGYAELVVALMTGGWLH